MNVIYKYTYENVTNIINGAKNILHLFYSNPVLTILTKLPLMESFITFDGMICASIFLRDYLLLNLIKLKAASRLDYKREIIKRYDRIYRLTAIDRYLFYLFIYFVYTLIQAPFDFNLNNYKYSILILIIPSIQNKLTSFLPLEYYIENKEIFLKYSFSKLMMASFQNLHNDIQKISNYNIFILYSHLSFDYIWAIVRNYLFVSVLYFLKNRDYTYFYYKATKVAYMYHTGYNFVSMSLFDSVYLANLIIKEKRWNELSKMEVINMFYVLIESKFSDPNSNLYVTSSIIFFQIFSIWSIISCIKIFGRIIPFNYKFVFYLGLIVAMYLLKFKNKTRKIITGFIVHYLLHFNINDIIITLIIIGHDIVYYILGEILFFIRNVRSIRKVVKIYESKRNQIPDFVLVNGSS